MAGVDAHGERRALALGVRRDHERQVEVLDPFRGEWDADEPGGVGQEERDLLGRDRIGRHDQVAFVLAVFVVDDHHDLAATNGLDRILDC